MNSVVERKVRSKGYWDEYRKALTEYNRSGKPSVSLGEDSARVFLIYLPVPEFTRFYSIDSKDTKLQGEKYRISDDS